MRKVSSRITERGQATIPVEVRRLLGLEPHDRIVFVIADDHIQVQRGTSTVDRTAGALQNGHAPRSIEQLRAVAEITFAREAMARITRG